MLSVLCLLLALFGQSQASALNEFFKIDGDLHEILAQAAKKRNFEDPQPSTKRTTDPAVIAANLESFFTTMNGCPSMRVSLPVPPRPCLYLLSCLLSLL